MNDKGIADVVGSIILLGIIMSIVTSYGAYSYMQNNANIERERKSIEMEYSLINYIENRIDWIESLGFNYTDDNSTGGIVPPPPVINNDSTITITVVAVDKEGIPYFVTWTQPYLVAVEVDP